VRCWNITPKLHGVGILRVRVIEIAGRADGDGDGLLGQHVNAALERGDRDGRVIVMRGGDEDGIDETAVEQVFGFRELLRVGLGASGVESLGIDIADRGELGVGDLREMPDVNRTHRSNADDAETYLVHVA
jgi:hypothetical protein